MLRGPRLLWTGVRGVVPESEVQLLNLCPRLPSSLVVGLGSSDSVSQVGSNVASTVIFSVDLSGCSVRCDLSVRVSVCGKLAV